MAAARYHHRPIDARTVTLAASGLARYHRRDGTAAALAATRASGAPSSFGADNGSWYTSAVRSEANTTATSRGI
jgi:hypothetical protein